MMNNQPTEVASNWGIIIQNWGVEFIMVSSMFHLNTVLSSEQKMPAEGQFSMAAFLKQG